MHIDSCLYQIISTIITKLNRQFNQSKLIHKIQYIDFSIDSLLILSIKKIQENKLIFLLQSLIFLLHVYLLKVHETTHFVLFTRLTLSINTGTVKETRAQSTIEVKGPKVSTRNFLQLHC